MLVDDLGDLLFLYFPGKYPWKSGYIILIYQDDFEKFIL
jgi:hypothetical protein